MILREVCTLSFCVNLHINISDYMGLLFYLLKILLTFFAQQVPKVMYLYSKQEATVKIEYGETR